MKRATTSMSCSHTRWFPSLRERGVSRLDRQRVCVRGLIQSIHQPPLSLGACAPCTREESDCEGGHMLALNHNSRIRGRMKDTKTKERFMELQGQGLPLAKIAVHE